MPDRAQSTVDQVGVRDPDERVTVEVTRAQAWDIYDQLVARAVALEKVEDEAYQGLGSGRYRNAANEVRRALA
jgi:hypothetical protein